MYFNSKYMLQFYWRQKGGGVLNILMKLTLMLIKRKTIQVSLSLFFGNKYRVVVSMKTVSRDGLQIVSN